MGLNAAVPPNFQGKLLASWGSGSVGVTARQARSNKRESSSEPHGQAASCNPYFLFCPHASLQDHFPDQLSA